MARRKAEPRWLTRQMLRAIHDAQLREHGGALGVRDEGLLESALTRARKFAYSGRADFAVLGAAYAYGLARNHGFVDGNKRVAFMAAYVFLGLNGQDLDVAETEAVSTMERVASGRLTEARLATWLHNAMRPAAR